GLVGVARVEERVAALGGEPRARRDAAALLGEPRGPLDRGVRGLAGAELAAGAAEVDQREALEIARAELRRELRHRLDVRQREGQVSRPPADPLEDAVRVVAAEQVVARDLRDGLVGEAPRVLALAVARHRARPAPAPR